MVLHCALWIPLDPIGLLDMLRMLRKLRKVCTFAIFAHRLEDARSPSHDESERFSTLKPPKFGRIEQHMRLLAVCITNKLATFPTKPCSEGP